LNTIKKFDIANKVVHKPLPILNPVSGGIKPQYYYGRYPYYPYPNPYPYPYPNPYPYPYPNPYPYLNNLSDPDIIINNDNDKLNAAVSNHHLGDNHRGHYNPGRYHPRHYNPRHNHPRHYNPRHHPIYYHTSKNPDTSDTIQPHLPRHIDTPEYIANPSQTPIPTPNTYSVPQTSNKQTILFQLSIIMNELRIKCNPNVINQQLNVIMNEIQNSSDF